jgi:GT2 family glycosyltransferase
MTAIAVVVLNWNGESDTAACLDSLLAQEGVALEILLVDNHSDDGSGERLHVRYPQLVYLQSGANLGYAAGNNQGLRWAMDLGADWVLVVNNDTVADVDCVRRLVTAAASDVRLGAVAPLITRFDDRSRIWFAGGHFDALRACGVHEHENEKVDELEGLNATGDRWRPSTFLSGCCVLFRVDALREVGLFREDFFAYVEDVELSMRLTNAGWRLGWVPAARLAHRVPPFRQPPTASQIVLRDRNRRRVARERLGPVARLAFLAWYWPSRLVLMVRYLAGGDVARTRAIFAGMWER